MRICFALFTACCLAGCRQAAPQEDYARYVNPFIGTDGTGHTFPGPSMPFGMVQPGPDNRDQGWDYTSGYQYRDSVLLGFSQTRFSGTGINEMGDVLLMPLAAAARPEASFRYVKPSERAEPGYYAVQKQDSVGVELTCSERVAFHRYTFPEQDARLLVSLQHGLRFITDSLVLESQVELVPGGRISGFCRTRNWVERRYFFVIEFDRAWQGCDTLAPGPRDKAPRLMLRFPLGAERRLQVKVALSAVSVEGAEQNLRAELPGWDFERQRRQARAAWNRYLSRVELEAPPARRTLFYTALYHLLLQPSNIADADGRYRGADDSVAQAPGGAYYSTFSNWDIYRAAFPLLQLLVPERIDAMVQSMLLHHRAAGFLPIWSAWGQDSYCMIGNHAIPMLLSAYERGFRGFDAQEALRAMVETSSISHVNSDWQLYERFGYYPFDSLDNESVSRTLESSFDDACVARMAALLGDSAAAARFGRRSFYYQHLFDPETGFFRGKDSRGQWRSPFDPLKATSPMNNPGDYTEANAWQYFWTSAQQDVPGLKRLLGGEAAFERKLDAFFSTESPAADKFLGQEALIGQYAHGNEPGHHVIYLYAFTSRPQRGHALIRQAVESFYRASPDGMTGNDDCGQMSAWYLFACMGFYPVNGGGADVVLGAPQAARIVIRRPGSPPFVIEARDFSEANATWKTAFLNGQPLTSPVLPDAALRAGGTLTFHMTPQ
ncbi:MAG: GH92 family glycosyl hydrolase [Bacteroidia bacterium]|nr:GH92 family glycosyl hydrolase [Bacteroidia bacterium]